MSHGHWKTTTFVAALRLGGLTAPLIIDEALNGDLSVAYVEQVLVPTLRPGEYGGAVGGAEAKAGPSGTGGARGTWAWSKRGYRLARRRSLLPHDARLCHCR